MWVLLFRLRRCVWDGGSLGRQGAYPMPLYRYARDNLLENAWGDNPRAYPERFTIVRETTSLGGERAQQAAYSLPSQRFSLALSFPHPPHSCGETSACDGSHDFRRQTLFSTVLCSIMGQQNSCIISQRGMGKKESGGLGEKTRKGKGDKHANAPPFPEVVSPSSGRTFLQRCSVS